MNATEITPKQNVGNHRWIAAQSETEKGLADYCKAKADEIERRLRWWKLVNTVTATK